MTDSDVVARHKAAIKELTAASEALYELFEREPHGVPFTDGSPQTGVLREALKRYRDSNSDLEATSVEFLRGA